MYFKDLFAKQLSSFKSQKIDQEYIKCYLRKVNKKTIKIDIKPFISLQELMIRIQEQTSLQKQDLMIYVNGKKYELNQQNNSSLLKIQNNQIIHLHDKKGLKKERITVYIQLFNEKFKKLVRKQFGVYSKQKIKTFSQVIKQKYQQLQDMQINLIESGRKLNQQKSFQEENIQDQITLTIMVNQDIQRLTEKKNQNKQIFKELQFNEKYFSHKINYYSPPKLDNNQVNDFDFILDPVQSFKKKQKNTMMYKISTKKNIGEIWESVGSSSQSQTNKKQLIKALWRKKQLKQEKLPNLFFKKSIQKSQQSQKNKFSVREKLLLKKQVKKLFQSQRLPSSYSEVKNLQPPKIVTDQFIDEIQEIQFCDDQSQKQKDIMLPFGFSTGLGQSIGKNKEKMSLQELIPTRDFDLDEMEI